MNEDASAAEQQKSAAKHADDKLREKSGLTSATSSIQDRYGARAAIRTGNRVVALILGVLTVVAIPLAGVIRSWPGLLGAVAGMTIMWIVAAVGIGANQLVLRNPRRTSGVVFGAYLVKLVIVIVAVAALRPLPQVDSTVIFLVLIVAILLTTIGEARAVSKTNKLIIEKL